jgi:hypothetical protein
VTGSNTHCCTFIGSYNVMHSITMVGDIRTNILQKRVRHACKAVDAVLSQFLYKAFWSNHFIRLIREIRVR